MLIYFGMVVFVIVVLIGCFLGKILWCGNCEGNVFKGIVNFFSGGLDFILFEFDIVDLDWVVIIDLFGLLGLIFIGLLEVFLRKKKILKFSKLGV